MSLFFEEWNGIKHRNISEQSGPFRDTRCRQDNGHLPSATRWQDSNDSWSRLSAFPMFPSIVHEAQYNASRLTFVVAWLLCATTFYTEKRCIVCTGCMYMLMKQVLESNIRCLRVNTINENDGEERAEWNVSVYVLESQYTVKLKCTLLSRYNIIQNTTTSRLYKSHVKSNSIQHQTKTQSKKCTQISGHSACCKRDAPIGGYCGVSLSNVKVRSEIRPRGIPTIICHMPRNLYI